MNKSTSDAKEKGLFGKGMSKADKNPSSIEPAKLTMDSKIRFRCHPGVSCFTACCGNIRIILTPFDILRLRKYLNMTADEFLLRFTVPTHIEKTEMPGVMIHLDDEGRCPFVTPEGCTIYPERPSACRYYPIGMASFHEGAQEGQTAERFFFKVKEEHCKGHEEETEWTVREWRKDQGVDLCDEMNSGWMELVMRKKSFGRQATLSEQGQKMFFMASTDTDKFRAFVFESSFLDKYEIDQETIDLIKEDDIALMKFSFRYLASSLFGTQDLKIREKLIKARIEEIDERREKASIKAEETYHELVKERDNLKKALGKA